MNPVLRSTAKPVLQFPYQVQTITKGYDHFINIVSFPDELIEFLYGLRTFSFYLRCSRPRHERKYCLLR